MDVNYIFILSLVIIIIGYVIKKLDIITEENGKVIAKIIFNITLPAVILKVASNIELNIALILLPLISLIFSFFVAGIGLIIFRNYPPKTKGIILMTIIGFNIGNFAFPLVDGIWGQEGLQYIAFVDIGNAITIFVVCYIFGSLFSPKLTAEDKKVDFNYIGRRLLKSPPLISYIIALTLNFSGIGMPIFFFDLLDILSRANNALTLLILGIYLNFKFEKAEWNTILKVLIIRYSIGLCVGLLLFFLLATYQYNHLFRIIVTISLILPVGLAIIPFSTEFGYDQKLVSIITTISIIISFFLMWILILLLNG